jgi:hypothetical protein
LAVGEAAAVGAQGDVADGELDQDEVDEQQLGRVVGGVDEGVEFLVGGGVEDGVVGGELGEGWLGEGGGWLVGGLVRKRGRGAELTIGCGDSG